MYLYLAAGPAPRIKKRENRNGLLHLWRNKPFRRGSEEEFQGDRFHCLSPERWMENILIRGAIFEVSVRQG